jgi:hypothetical protein
MHISKDFSGRRNCLKFKIELNLGRILPSFPFHLYILSHMFLSESCREFKWLLVFGGGLWFGYFLVQILHAVIFCIWNEMHLLKKSTNLTNLTHVWPFNPFLYHKKVRKICWLCFVFLPHTHTHRNIGFHYLEAVLVYLSPVCLSLLRCCWFCFSLMKFVCFSNLF